jgi:hypothetical protein
VVGAVSAVDVDVVGVVVEIAVVALTAWSA